MDIVVEIVITKNTVQQRGMANADVAPVVNQNQ
jgi:hypothetical protein